MMVLYVIVMKFFVSHAKLSSGSFVVYVCCFQDMNIANYLNLSAIAARVGDVVDIFSELDSLFNTFRISSSLKILVTVLHSFRLCTFNLPLFLAVELTFRCYHQHTVL